MTASLPQIDSIIVFKYRFLTFQPLGQKRGSLTLFMSSTEIVNLKEFNLALSLLDFIISWSFTPFCLMYSPTSLRPSDLWTVYIKRSLVGGGTAVIPAASVPFPTIVPRFLILSSWLLRFSLCSCLFCFHLWSAGITNVPGNTGGGSEPWSASCCLSPWLLSLLARATPRILPPICCCCWILQPLATTYVLDSPHYDHWF